MSTLSFASDHKGLLRPDITALCWPTCMQWWCSFPTQKFNKGKNGDISPRYPNTYTVKCWTLWLQTDSAMKETDEQFNGARGLAPSAKQWLVGGCLPWDILWWEVACKFSDVPRDVCQALWPSSTPSSSSRPSIQAPSIYGWYLIWAGRASGLEMYLYKLYLNWIWNLLKKWFGSDLQKLDQFFAFQTIKN